MILISMFVVFVAAFLLASIAVLISFMMLQRRQHAAAGTAEIEAGFDSPALLKEETLSSISVWHRLLAQFDFVASMKTRIFQAGLDWPVGRVTAMMLLLGAFALAVLSKVSWIPGLVSFALSLFVAAWPYLYVLRRRAKRFARFEDQLPDALDFLARALRAGHPFAATLEMLTCESSPPLTAEMRITADEVRLGASLDQALDHLSRRVPLLNVRLFAAAVKLQSRTGGKLSEVLGRLAETMRESMSLVGEVRSIAAHGKMSGRVLTVLPIAIAVMMMIVNPAYLGVLADHPTGKYLITAAIVCLVLAHFVIRKIVDIRL